MERLTDISLLGSNNNNTAMPQDIPPYDFGLSGESERIQMLKDLKSSGKVKQVATYRNIPLHATGPYRFMEVDGELVYVASLLRKHFSKVGEVVLQTGVWKSIDGSRGFASEIALNQYLTKQISLMSDHKQTDLGRRMWASLVRDAFARQLSVYFVRLNHRAISAIESMDDFIAYGKSLKVYSKAKDSRNWRVLISHNSGLANTDLESPCGNDLVDQRTLDDEAERVNDELQQSKIGDYNNPPDGCPNCGRSRVMLGDDKKHRCEKCHWCIEDNEVDAPFSDYMR